MLQGGELDKRQRDNPEMIFAGVPNTIRCAASAPTISAAACIPKERRGLRQVAEWASVAMTSTTPALLGFLAEFTGQTANCNLHRNIITEQIQE